MGNTVNLQHHLREGPDGYVPFWIAICQFVWITSEINFEQVIKKKLINFEQVQ